MSDESLIVLYNTFFLPAAGPMHANARVLAPVQRGQLFIWWSLQMICDSLYISSVS